MYKNIHDILEEFFFDDDMMMVDELDNHIDICSELNSHTSEIISEFEFEIASAINNHINRINETQIQRN